MVSSVAVGLQLEAGEGEEEGGGEQGLSCSGSAAKLRSFYLSLQPPPPPPRALPFSVATSLTLWKLFVVITAAALVLFSPATLFTWSPPLPFPPPPPSRQQPDHIVFQNPLCPPPSPSLVIAGSAGCWCHVPAAITPLLFSFPPPLRSLSFCLIGERRKEQVQSEEGGIFAEGRKRKTELKGLQPNRIFLASFPLTPSSPPLPAFCV